MTGRPLMEWTPERIKRFWDWQSQYPETYFTRQFGAQIAAALEPHLSGANSVLDFGCGAGHLLPHLAARFPEVYGTDLSPASRQTANELLQGHKNFQGVLPPEELEPLRGGLDAILLIEVIEHLSDEDLKDALDAVLALLKPNGLAVFTTPNNEDLSKSMIMCPASGELFHRWQHVRSWTPVSLANTLTARGFDVARTIETDLSVDRRPNPKAMAKRLIKRLISGPQGAPHLICIARRTAD